MPAPTNAEIAYQMSGLNDRWRLYTTQLRDWLGGTADGGPGGDGAYPLQDATGLTFLVPCPAAWSSKVTDLTDPLDGIQVTVEASVTAGQAAQAAAEQASNIALTYRDAAIQAASDSSMYATNSANSAAAANTSKNSAAASASAAQVSASAADASKSAAATSATEAATSASASATSSADSSTNAAAAAQSALAASDYAAQAAQAAAGKLAWFGVWNISGGSLPPPPAAPGFYLVSGAATIGSVTYQSGDMLVWGEESAWHRIDNQQTVASVAGLVGNISVGQLQAALNLATVATSGNYNDLSNKPTLGTAAAKNIGDFATPAQGAKADGALQQTSGAFTGDFNALQTGHGMASIKQADTVANQVNGPGLNAYPTTITVIPANTGCQMAFGIDTSRMSLRGWTAWGGWTPWAEVWTTANFNPANYLPLTGGTVTGGLNVTTTVDTYTLLASFGPGDPSKRIYITSNSGDIAFDHQGWYGSGVMTWKFVGSTKMTLTAAGNLSTTGTIVGSNLTGTNTGDQSWETLPGRPSVGSVYVQSADPGAVADGSLWVW